MLDKNQKLVVLNTLQRMDVHETFEKSIIETMNRSDITKATIIMEKRDSFCEIRFTTDDDKNFQYKTKK